MTTIVQANPGYQIVRTGLTPCPNTVLAWAFEDGAVYALTVKGRMKLGPTVGVLLPDNKVEAHDGRVFRNWQEWCDWATRH